MTFDNMAHNLQNWRTQIFAMRHWRRQDSRIILGSGSEGRTKYHCVLFCDEEALYQSTWLTKHIYSRHMKNMLPPPRTDTECTDDVYQLAITTSTLDFTCYYCVATFGQRHQLLGHIVAIIPTIYSFQRSYCLTSSELYYKDLTVRPFELI